MNKKLIGTFCLIITMVLTGCQTTRSNPDVDPRLSQNEDIEFFSKSGITACMGGAAVGALACLAVDSKNRTGCMIAAAVVGCGVGVGANAYLDNQRKTYSNKEQQLNAMISDIQQENQRLKSASSTAKSVIADDKRELAKINQDIAQKRLDQKAAEKKLKGVDANIASLQKSLTDMKKRQREWKEISEKSAAQGMKTAQLDTQIAEMKTQVSSLEKELDSLYSQRTAIKIS
ncbi:hypothetical protein [Providencia alcalifaciens]|uniref:hypothetical protein n=1 Tax=Providencia alcalifaciens TaxID=126385 RepID=UPI001CC42860|nr:hypothetical protein [Providencia alcalifaciens]CAG9430030.1 hypothetical protein NVI2019_GHJFPKLH_03124 [Providencia alcalifaciens]